MGGVKRVPTRRNGMEEKGLCSVVDSNTLNLKPDSIRIRVQGYQCFDRIRNRIQGVFWIRIRIRTPDPNSDPGA